LAILALAICLLPSAFWVARTARATGVAALADSRAVVSIREELDLQLATESAFAAALRWTPLELARRQGERRGSATIDTPRWTGEGNYLSRAWRKRSAAIRAEGEKSPRPAPGISLAVDRELVGAALGTMVRMPLVHARVTLAVAWRSIFSERSPEWLRPLDATFALGVALAFAFTALLAAAVRHRAAPLLALLLPASLLFAGHALFTEGLPRYGWPTLPVVWVALVVGFVALRRGALTPPDRPE
jgi:hypothetical protein